MALIKCPECGAEISEKAYKCPHCGRENQVLLNVKENEKRQQQKRIIGIIIIVVVLAALVISALILFEKNGHKSNDHLYGLKWGTDIESAYKKIQKVYSKSELVEEFEIVREDRGVFGVVKDFEGRKDISCRVILECKNNDTLTAVDHVYMIGDNSAYTASTLENELYDELVKKYGMPVDDKYGYEWHTDNSKIFLVTADEENVVLSYAQLDW